MKRRSEPERPWTVWEVCRLDDAKRADKRYVSEDLAGEGSDPSQALKDMKLAGAMGFPDASKSLIIEKVDSKKPPIFVLKAKPSCWRLYFHVDGQQRRLVFLYAVCKKKTKRDQEDATKARTRLFAAGSGLIQFAFAPEPDLP